MRTLLAFCTLITNAPMSIAQTGWTVTNIPDGGRYDDLFFINDSVGWAAGGPTGWIYKTTNAGDTWDLQFNTPLYLRSIEFINADIGFAGTLNGVLYRTVDGGENWDDISANIAQQPAGICGLSVADASTIYGCGIWSGPAFVIKSIDGGASWSYIDMSAYATRLVDILFISADVGFATGTAAPASNGGVILHTTDGGASWSTVCTTNALSDIVWKIQQFDDQHCFASIYSEPINDDTRMLRSADGGMNWEQITVSEQYTYNEAIGFMDPLHGWAGGDEVLWETMDGGVSWQAYSFGSSHNRFMKVSATRAFLSGAHIYKYEEGITTTVLESATRTEYHTLTVSPNPSDGRIAIRLWLGRATIAELKVLAADGRLVKELLRQPAQLGEYRFDVDLQGEAGQAYFVVLRTNEGMRYEKVVVK
jgi:photosystem II stability/assembly factor-like uncharacterized protein